MSQSEQDLLKGLACELIMASSPYLSLDLTAEQALIVFGAMQLSLRHPGLDPRLKDKLREMAEVFECQLASLGPNVREICRMGWQQIADFDAA